MTKRKIEERKQMVKVIKIEAVASQFIFKYTYKAIAARAEDLGLVISERMAGTILQELGYKRVKIWFNGQSMRGYRK